MHGICLQGGVAAFASPLYGLLLTGAGQQVTHLQEEEEGYQKNDHTAVHQALQQLAL